MNPGDTPYRFRLRTCQHCRRAEISSLSIGKQDRCNAPFLGVTRKGGAPVSALTASPLDQTATASSQQEQTDQERAVEVIQSPQPDLGTRSQTTDADSVVVR